MAPIDFSGTNPVGTPSATDVFSAGSQAISFKEQLPDLEAKLRDALSSKVIQSPLYQQRETAQQQFLAAPSAIRGDIEKIQQGGTILSPVQQEQITGARRAAAFAPLSTANLMLNTQFGGMENMISGGVKAFEAASNAQTERANLMNKMREQEFERQIKEKEFALSVQKANQSGGLSISEALSIFQKMQPTADQEKQADAATDAKAAIKDMQSILTNDPWAFRLKGGPFKIFSPNAQKLDAIMLRLKDPIIRTRTGAALTPDELIEYDKLVGDIITGKGVIEDNLKNLDKIYDKVIVRGSPDPAVLNFLSNLGLGVGNLGSQTGSGYSFTGRTQP